MDYKSDAMAVSQWVAKHISDVFIMRPKLMAFAQDQIDYMHGKSAALKLTLGDPQNNAVYFYLSGDVHVQEHVRVFIKFATHSDGDARLPMEPGTRGCWAPLSLVMASENMSGWGDSDV